MQQNTVKSFLNPFKPGAGHAPPHLAGRTVETDQFKRLITQSTILENMVITGLRGTGKTVLLDSLKPIAITSGWLWVGTNLSESSSVSEEMIALWVLTDISVLTSDIIVSQETKETIGFENNTIIHSQKMNYDFLVHLFSQTPGLVSDKLKAVLEFVWLYVNRLGVKGVVFAYDEAQSMSDRAERDQYPLSTLLDVFQSIQKKDIPFMLLLVGLPTLMPKLVETRTFSERMFRVITLGKLNEEESKDAIVKPIQDTLCPVKFTFEAVQLIADHSGGYPYFIQFICKETYDVFIQKITQGEASPSVPVNEIITKLDNDFFSGRWQRATDKQRELLKTISSLPNHEAEFTIHEIVDKMNEKSGKKMTSAAVGQMLNILIENGLIHKNRYGKYCFAVPLLGRFIQRQPENSILD